MDPQKSPVAGATPEGQSDQNEVSVNLNTNEVQPNGLGVPAQDGAASADASQPQPDFTTPAAPVADPGTSFSPTPVTDMQSGDQSQSTEQTAQDEMAQLATAQAGVELPTDAQQTSSVEQALQAAPTAPEAMSAPEQPVTPELTGDPSMQVAPDASAASAPADAPSAGGHGKMVVVILGVVAVVLLAAIAALYFMQ